MSSQDRNRSLSRAATAGLAIGILFALTVLITASAQTQTFKVIHNFTGPDGDQPGAGVTLDAAGNLYGTTEQGGAASFGNVFELKPWHGNWVMNNLFAFNSNNGNLPFSGVVFGPDGALYGTTYFGGSAFSGVVYSLRPPATACKTVLCPWTETTFTNLPVAATDSIPSAASLSTKPATSTGQRLEEGPWAGVQFSN